jgi:hypothetical protein
MEQELNTEFEKAHKDGRKISFKWILVIDPLRPLTDDLQAWQRTDSLRTR